MQALTPTRPATVATPVWAPAPTRVLLAPVGPAQVGSQLCVLHVAASCSLTHMYVHCRLLWGQHRQHWWHWHLLELQPSASLHGPNRPPPLRCLLQLCLTHVLR